MEGVAVWQLGRCCGVEVWLAGRGRTVWRFGWLGEGERHGGLVGGERESEMRESNQIRSGDLGFFFSLKINGRAGRYPPDKKLKTRGLPETQIRKIIKFHIRPCSTCGRAVERMGQAVLSGGSVFTGFCPPLDRSLEALHIVMGTWVTKV